MNPTIVAIPVATSLLAGCATPKYWEATGGGPAEGRVQPSYEDTPFEYSQTRESQGLAIATGRCQFWDYKHAERAGVEKSVCRTMGKFHCVETLVTQDYICRQ